MAWDIKSVRYPLGKGQKQCEQLASEGWEPFAVTSGSSGRDGDSPTMFFKRES